MADDRRSFRALAKLLPAGVLGLSIGLAAVGAQATSAAGPSAGNGSVAARLKAIRSSVSDVIHDASQETDNPVELAWWGNGWHRGWGNGGWGNGGWHNGGWGNGGWHNGGWGNGWHNGWHNW